MWNAPDGFFEMLIGLAMVGAIALAILAGWLVYIVASNITIGWG